MPPTDTEHAEEIRFAVRRYLAGRPQAAVTLDMIQNALSMKGLDSTEADTKAALAYWTSTEPQQVREHRLPHSALKAWQITAAGTLAHSRGE